MIARPKMSQNEWKTTEIRASKVGNFSPFSCPGDTLVMEVEITNWKAKFGIAKATGKAYVDGNLAVEVGEMTFALAK